MHNLPLPLLLLFTCLVWPGLVSAQAPPDIYFNNFEYPDMRALPCFQCEVGMPIIQPGEISMPANGGVCLGTPGSGVCTSFSYVDGRLDFGARTTTGGADARHIVNDPINCRGNWCWQFDSPGGGIGPEASWRTGIAGPNRVAQGCTTFYDSYPASCVSYNLFFSYWIKFATNFTAEIDDSLSSVTCQGKLFYVQSKGGTNFVFSNPPMIDHFGALGVPAWFYNTATVKNLSWFSSGQEGRVGNFTSAWNDGQWHHYEVQTDTVNQFVRVWRDEVLIISGPVQFVQNAGVDNNEWGVYFNRNGTGQDNCKTLQATSFWMDDIAVSTQRIGGASVPVLPPQNPTNFQFTRLWRRLVSLWTAGWWWATA